ncbi:MAG: hypothetical protein GXP28_01220 [Planctomycetes bacterium]|nr:hypothetical protein [Planctomycetota bacterium]
MSTASYPLPMPKPVTRKVARLRWLVRMYVALEGLASIVLVLGGAFWLGLAIDWTFEPVPFIRVVLWLMVAMLAGYVASRFLFARIFRRLPNSSMALLLERNFPELGESLVTTIEAGESHRPSPLGHQKLLQHTGDEAAAAMGHVHLLQIFQFRPLLWKSSLAAILALSILALAFLQADVFGFWVARMQLDDTPWPRQVELSVRGFDQYTVKVARDDDFQLEVEASIREGHAAPDVVEIRYRLADGRRGRDTMTRVGEALSGRDDHQLFRYTFKNVVTDLEFDLIGGDDRLRDLKLRVVERPQIIRMLLDCEFPEYMQRSPQSIPVSGRVELPEGTMVRCRVRANKSLEQITLYDSESQQELTATIDSPEEFRFAMKIGSQDRVLLITMLDTDGVKNREPYRVVVSVVPDLPPEVSVQLLGISSAVTPRAIIPFAGQITDEYGLEEAWFEYQVDQNPPQPRPLATQPRGRRQLTEINPFDLAETQTDSKSLLTALHPGQQLTLSVKARDAYDLQSEPHVGSSHRFLLDIVTASELRAMLEKRELGLRQRFEAIYEKMVDTSELLRRIGVEPSAPAEETERRRQRDRLRISGSLQNVTQLAYETLGVADGFEEIVRELINNRVDTEELKQRLGEGIADPLREIGSELMPRLEEVLQQYESAFTEKASTEARESKEHHGVAVAQAEVVSEAMKQVLDRMLELESYNELVELLRGIVAEQKQLEEKTKQQRREKLRRLLEE